METPTPAARLPVLVLSTAADGGAEHTLAQLAQGLPGLGFEPSVLLIEPGPLEGRLAQAGVTDVTVARESKDVHALARRMIDETEARLVLSSKWRAQFHGGRAARDAGIPAIFWQHDIARPTVAQIEACALPPAAVVCPSRFAVEAQRWLTPDAEIVRIAPGVDVRELASRATRAPLDRTNIDEPLVGIVGRLAAFKGQHVFLEAAALVSRRRGDVRFVVVGGPATDRDRGYPDRLRRLAVNLGLEARLQFAGHQSDVVPWLNALDVAVHATDGEPFGLVLIEAMLLGTPVVATNLGGPAEIVEHQRSGWLVPPGRPHDTAEAILAILGDSSLRQRLSAGGHRRAAAFTGERMSAEFASLFERVLAPAPRVIASP